MVTSWNGILLNAHKLLHRQLYLLTTQFIGSTFCNVRTREFHTPFSDPSQWHPLEHPCTGCSLGNQEETFPFWFSLYYDFHFSLLEAFFSLAPQPCKGYSECQISLFWYAFKGLRKTAFTWQTLGEFYLAKPLPLEDLKPDGNFSSQIKTTLWS